MRKACCAINTFSYTEQSISFSYNKYEIAPSFSFMVYTLFVHPGAACDYNSVTYKSPCMAGCS